MTIMDRNISYQINGLEKPQKISGFLKEKGVFPAESCGFA